MTTKPFVFTLMPFSHDYDDIYKLGIKETAQNLGTYCERVDEQIFDGTILDRIINQINKADIIVADMTGKNPNVFFEVGYAKALNKKIILLTQSAYDIPFDLKHYPHIVYSGKIISLKESLQKSLQHYLAKPEASSEELQLGVDLKIKGIILTPNEETLIPIEQNYGPVLLSIKNRTNILLKGGKLQIGGIGKFLAGLWPDADTKVIELSEDTTMDLYTHPNDIFPQGWDSVKLFDISINYTHAGTLRVFSENGSFDFKFKEVKKTMS